MIHRYDVNEFLLEIPSVADGTQPVAVWGTSVTPAQNAYGSYAQLLSGASVTEDCQEIEIEVNTVGASTLARNCLVTIGIDPAGGTSYTDTIVDLLAGPAGSHAAAAFAGSCGGVYFTFPLRIPAGCSVGAKASVNSATLTALGVACTLRGRPTRPDLIFVGSFVQTFGSTPASSSGTAVVPGTSSDGTDVQIGSALTAGIRYWEFGYGINDATMTSNLIEVDLRLGDASNKRTILRNGVVYTSGGETLNKPRSQGRYAKGAIGDIVYARAQVGPSAADASNSIAVYGVG